MYFYIELVLSEIKTNVLENENSDVRNCEVQFQEYNSSLLITCWALSRLGAFLHTLLRGALLLTTCDQWITSTLHSCCLVFRPCGLVLAWVAVGRHTRQKCVKFLTKIFHLHFYYFVSTYFCKKCNFKTILLMPFCG